MTAVLFTGILNLTSAPKIVEMMLFSTKNVFSFILHYRIVQHIMNVHVVVHLSVHPSAVFLFPDDNLNTVFTIRI